MITAEKFKSMSKNERRVHVAKDVLSMLKKSKIGTTHSAIIKLTPKIVAKLKMETGDQLQDHLPGLLKTKACKVCAVGSCLLSIVGITDKYKVSRRLADSPINCYTVSANDYDTVSKVFGKRITYLIERIYENGKGAMHLHYGDFHESPMICDILIAAAENYGRSINRDKRKIAAIMENIIANKGNLIIPKKFFPKTYCGAPINDFAFESQTEKAR